MPGSALLANVVVNVDLLGDLGWTTPDSRLVPLEREKFAGPLHSLLFDATHRRVKRLAGDDILCGVFRVTDLELLLADREAKTEDGEVPGVLIASIEPVENDWGENLDETLASTIRKDQRRALELQLLGVANSQQLLLPALRSDEHAPNVTIYPFMFLGVSPLALTAHESLVIRQIATTTPQSEHGATRDEDRRTARATAEQYAIHDTLLGTVATWGSAFKAAGGLGTDDPGRMIAYQFVELAAYLRLEAALLLRVSSVFAAIANDVQDTRNLRIRHVSLTISEELRKLLVREMRYRSAVAAQPLVFRKFIKELEKQFQVAHHRVTLQADAESITAVVRLVEDAREAGYRRQVSTLANIFGVLVAVFSLVQVPPSVAQLAHDLWGAPPEAQVQIQLWTLLGMAAVILGLTIWRFAGIVRQRGRL